MSNSLQEYLKRMEGSVRKLDEFIKEVISYSRNTRMELEFVDVNFKSIVESALEDHQYSTNFDKIEFRISPSTDQIIKSDLVRLKIILNNLLSNAIKFHIVDNVEIKPYVSIDLSIENGKYYITVEDNGRGIGKEYLDSIFDMFFRATSEVQGSGLGLYILKEAVVKLGGTISVDSELGKGAKFTVILPAPTIK
jgi:signal transduction histidine kinase